MSARLFDASPDDPADFYAPFAAAVDALRPMPCEALARAGRRVESAAPGEPLQLATSRMGWRKVGALAVIEDGRLVGSLSEDDLLRVLATRLRESAADVDDQGAELPLWDALLGKLQVADAMTPRAELPVVQPGASLPAGIEQICAATTHGTRFRYIWVLGEDERVACVLSIRDAARGVTRVYDGQFPPGSFPDPALAEEARRAVAAVLDLPIAVIRERLTLGHAPSIVRNDAPGEETVSRMWEDRRGYVVTTLRDGAPLGICTRRDVLRGLRHPFARLEDLAVARLMTCPVQTVSEGNTLCGLFKLMAIEGCRHMPLVDDDDRVVRVISMWEGVALFAPRRSGIT